MAKIIKFRTAYGERKKVVTVNEEPSMTEQAHTKMCDINRIIAQYDRTGVIAHVSKFEAKYGDFTAPEYQDMLFMVKEAENTFSELPSVLRKRFGNDVGQFLAFMDDESNYDEAVKLGLIETPSLPTGDENVEASTEAVTEATA